MMNAIDPVNDLINFYYNFDFKEFLLDEHEIRNTIEDLLKKGRILTVYENGQLIGYIESWRINYEQLGRILCDIPFDIWREDIEHGNICYIANITVHPDHKDKGVLQTIRKLLYEQNIDCDYFIGERRKGKYQPLIVFTHMGYHDQYLLERGEEDGKE